MISFYCNNNESLKYHMVHFENECIHVYCSGIHQIGFVLKDRICEPVHVYMPH